jgi:hypothetical protein
MKRPWTVALIAAAGVTLLAAGAFAMLAPPELLQAAVELGDPRLWAVVAACFAVVTLLARLSMVRRHTPEDDVVEPPPVQGGSHLR